jgi:DNA-binding GntR family transcriptional regulator
MNPMTSDAVYEQLQKKIVSGEYPPGMRLVDQTLADEMEVGAPAIQEALRHLIGEELVEQVTGQGTFVREFSSRDVIKLYTLREQIEIFAVSEAADNIQAHQRQALEEICETQAGLAEKLSAMDPAAPDKSTIHQWHLQDLAFHRAIVDASDNSFLQHAVERTRLLAHALRCKPRDVVPEGTDELLSEHREILAAIVDGDAFLGGDIMGTHVRRSMDAQLRYLEQAGK